MADISTLMKKYEPQFAEFLDNRLSKIEEEVSALMKEKAEIIEALKDYRTPERKNVPTVRLDYSEINGKGMPYRSDMSTIERAMHFANTEYLTIHDIATKIYEIDKSVPVSDLKNGLSAVLAMDNKSKNPRMIRRQNNNNKWEYKAKNN